MKIVKITVLDTSLREDLVKKYGNPQLKPCGVLKAGDVFYATNTCPKGMCDCAWRTMNQYVFALSYLFISCYSKASYDALKK